MLSCSGSVTHPRLLPHSSRTSCPSAERQTDRRTHDVPIQFHHLTLFPFSHPSLLVHQSEQYVTRAATALRQGLKEPAKSKALQQEVFAYNANAWTAGKTGTKKAVKNLAEAGII